MLSRIGVAFAHWGPTMPVPRVLVIHTIRDETVEERIRALAARPGLQGTEVHHAFILGPEEERRFVRERYLRPSDLIREHERRIFARLDNELSVASPDVCVLHTGLAFRFALREVVSICADLKAIHPTVIFGIQEAGWLAETLKSEGAWLASEIDRLFDRSAETRTLVNLLF